MCSQPSNMQCPHCNRYSVERVSQMNPMDYNIQVKYICTNCGREVLDPDSVTYSNSSDGTYTSASSADKYCENCNTKMVQYDSWWECPNCHYGYIDYIGDPPQDNIEMSKKIFEGKLHIPCDNVWGVGKTTITDPIAQNTLTIERCEKIKMHHKEMDIDFEFDTKKIENINTIIINGYKFVRENSETDNT